MLGREWRWKSTQQSRQSRCMCENIALLFFFLAYYSQKRGEKKKEESKRKYTSISGYNSITRGVNNNYLTSVSESNCLRLTRTP